MALRTPQCSTPAQSTFVPLLFVVARVRVAIIWRGRIEGAAPKTLAFVGALPPRKFCEKMFDPYLCNSSGGGWSGGPWQAILRLEIALGPAAKEELT